jgi:Fe-S oxidoreductase
MKVPVVSELHTEGKSPEILFWVGCAGSFDQRAQKITRAFAIILNKLEINYAILGKEEMCTGDPVRRAGNEFIFQMMAYQNIQTLNNYNIKKIVTACPHCFNTIKNEYPALGGNYEVIHHTSFLPGEHVRPIQLRPPTRTRLLRSDDRGECRTNSTDTVWLEAACSSRLPLARGIR